MRPPSRGAEIDGNGACVKATGSEFLLSAVEGSFFSQECFAGEVGMVAHVMVSVKSKKMVHLAY